MPVFLKYGTIKGDVTEPGHPGWIELNSAQIGSYSSQHGGTTGGHEPHDIVVTKNQDSASPVLFQESLTGKGTFVTIDFVKEGSVYLRVEMTGTLISSISISGGGDRPTEALTLNFEKLVYKQTPGEPAK